MSNLSAVFEVDYDSEPLPSITVQGGASWGDVIQAAYNGGLVPPIVIGSTVHFSSLLSSLPSVDV